MMNGKDRMMGKGAKKMMGSAMGGTKCYTCGEMGHTDDKHKGPVKVSKKGGKSGS